MNSYNNIIMDHYSKVAIEDGNSALSTMKDEYVRRKEKEAILQIVQNRMEANNDSISVVDVGCGNGYTLSVLEEKYHANLYMGIEKNKDLREIAKIDLDQQRYVLTREMFWTI